ncbi:MAG: RNA polymerase sigma factor [Anaerolineae bacterium]
MEHSAREDEVLIQLVAQGKTDALAELYDRYGRLVFSLAIDSVGDAATAEEITQDVFTSVWEKAHTYRSDQARVRTWLTSIARHRAIDALRRKGVRPEGHSVAWTAMAPSAVPSTGSPEETLELSEQRQRVRADIARLPEEQRLVLSMAFYQGYTHRQIAETLGHPLGTVKTRIRLAMQKLRDSLQDGQEVEEANPVGPDVRMGK